MTHICVRKLTIFGSDNGLSPCRRQVIIWINTGMLLTRTLVTNFGEIFGEIHTFSFKKMHLKMSSVTWRQFRRGLDVLKRWKRTGNTKPLTKHSEMVDALLRYLPLNFAVCINIRQKTFTCDVYQPPWNLAQVSTPIPPSKPWKDTDILSHGFPISLELFYDATYLNLSPST